MFQKLKQTLSLYLLVPNLIKQARLCSVRKKLGSARYINVTDPKPIIVFFGNVYWGFVVCTLTPI